MHIHASRAISCFHLFIHHPHLAHVSNVSRLGRKKQKQTNHSACSLINHDDTRPIGLAVWHIYYIDTNSHSHIETTQFIASSSWLSHTYIEAYEEWWICQHWAYTTHPKYVSVIEHTIRRSHTFMYIQIYTNKSARVSGAEENYWQPTSAYIQTGQMSTGLEFVSTGGGIF